MNNKPYKFDTLQVHAGQEPDKSTGSRAVPIYQTSSYVFENAEHAADLFSLKQFGNIYTRLMNPTNDVLEKRLAALEGGVGAVVTSSGQSAISYSIMNIAGQGDEIVSSSNLYGGTYALFSNVLPKYGIKVILVDPSDPENFRKAITPKTKALYGEVIGNPGLNVLDLEKVSGIAHEVEIPLIIDGTFATPYLCRPFEWGADVVIHSTTKWIGGHGLAIGGVVIDSGKFDWTRGKFPSFTEPDKGYHNMEWSKTFGELAYIIKVRLGLMRPLGACQAPFQSFLFLQGLETLSLRMERHCSNAQKVAEFLESNDKVNWVNYPGLKNHPDYELANKYLPKGKGGVVGFGIKGGLESGVKFINNVKLCSLLANVGDAKTLVIHPASTTHQQLTPEQQKHAGVTEDFIRISVGIEDVDDIIADIKQALEFL